MFDGDTFDVAILNVANIDGWGCRGTLEGDDIHSFADNFGAFFKDDVLCVNSAFNADGFAG